jgi:hypothetical protein
MVITIATIAATLTGTRNTPTTSIAIICPPFGSTASSGLASSV